MCGSVGLPELAIIFGRLVLHRTTQQNTPPCSVLSRPLLLLYVRAMYNSNSILLYRCTLLYRAVCTHFLRVSTLLHVGGCVGGLVYPSWPCFHRNMQKNTPPFSVLAPCFCRASVLHLLYRCT